MRIGTEIKVHLVKIGMTQIELSKRLKIAHCLVNKFVNGWYNLPEKHEKKLCKILNICHDSYMKGKIKALK